MQNLHGKLMEKDGAYAKWHKHPQHHIFQWLILLAVVLLIGGAVLNRIREYGESYGLLGEASASAPDEAGGKVGEVKDYVLAKLQVNLPARAAEQALSRHGLTKIDEIPGIKVLKLRVPPGKEARQVVSEIRGRDSAFEFIEVDEIFAPEIVPNDQYYGSQWALPKTSAPQGWDTSTGSPAVIIGIADTGVDCNHPDLSTKCVPGWNFYNNNSDTSDVYGHGTKVAGTATAITNNTAGVAGVCWGCKIMPLRISGTDGYATYSAGANAITYAADHGVRVVNISYRMSESSTVRSAAQYMQNKGGVVTISAGNQGEVISTADNPYVLTVSGTDSNDNKYSWSNSGNIIDVAAPGCTYTTTRGGGYGSACGTSFSAPMTAGLAGVIISYNSGLSGSQVQDVIKQGADDLGPAGWDPTYGWGRINLNGALLKAGGGIQPPPPDDTQAPSAPSNLSVSAPDSTKVNLSWTASTDNVSVAGYQVFRNNGQIATTQNTGYTDASVSSDTTYTYTVRAYDAAGNLSAFSNSTTVTVPAPDPVGVQISSYSVTTTVNSATIYWTTNIPSTGRVDYGANSGNLNNTSHDYTVGTSHSVTLTGLNRNTRYYYRITAVSENGATTAQTGTNQFRTKNR